MSNLKKAFSEVDMILDLIDSEMKLVGWGLLILMNLLYRLKIKV